MTQITYHPAFDPYHQIFRTCRLILAAGEPFDGNKLRIADFYLLFPERILDIRLSRELRSEAGKLSIEPRFPYDRMPNAQMLFARMEHTFQAAVQTMLHFGLIDAQAAVEKNLLALGPSAGKDTPFLERARTANHEEQQLMDFLVSLIRSFPYLGVNGLKDRTALEEYRYDAA